MPLPAERLDHHADHGEPARHALGGAPLGTFGLALDAPGVPVLLDMARALLERVAALRAEEVAKVPVLSQGDGVRAENRGLAVFALGGVEFVPVEVAEVAVAGVAVFCHGLALDVGDRLSSSTALDPIKTLGAHGGRFVEDFECFESGSAREADKALGVEFLCSSSESYDSSFNGQLALLAGSCCSPTR